MRSTRNPQSFCSRRLHRMLQYTFPPEHPFGRVACLHDVVCAVDDGVSITGAKVRGCVPQRYRSRPARQRTTRRSRTMLESFTLASLGGLAKVVGPPHRANKQVRMAAVASEMVVLRMTASHQQAGTRSSVDAHQPVPSGIGLRSSAGTSHHPSPPPHIDLWTDQSLSHVI